MLNLPSCKVGNDFFEGTCVSSSGDLGIDELKFLQIIATPKLPDIIELPLVQDEFIGKIGYAFPGSSPSFEVQLSFTPLEFNVLSADLIDSSGMTFSNIPFKITDINNTFDRFILTVSIPDGVAPGESAVYLNLSDGTFLNGIIQIVGFSDVEVITIKNPNRRDLGKPIIKRVFVKKHGRKITLRIRGKNFINRQIFYDKNGSIIFLKNPHIPDPNTEITIYPENLNSRIKKRVVRHKNRSLKIEFILPQNVNGKTEAVVVIATPEGIASAAFKIKRKDQRLVIPIQPTTVSSLNP